MKIHAGATAESAGAYARAEATVENQGQGWAIAGASGQNAEAHASIEGGRGDVIAYETQLNGRRIAMAIAIGNEPTPMKGPPSSTLIGRAGYLRR